jgi:hypothetical protein
MLSENSAARKHPEQTVNRVRVGVDLVCDLQGTARTVAQHIGNAKFGGCVYRPRNLRAGHEIEDGRGRGHHSLFGTAQPATHSIDRARDANGWQSSRFIGGHRELLSDRPGGSRAGGYFLAASGLPM